MNLPGLVTQISKTYTDSQALWSAVGLPDHEMEQRRESFFTALTSVCDEFFGQQRAYMDYVEAQVQQSLAQAQQLQVKLNLSLDLPTANSKDSLYVVLQRLERMLKTLQEEFQKRSDQANRLLSSIQSRSYRCGVEMPLQLQEIFGCPVEALPQFIQQNAATLQQLAALAALQTDFEKQTQFLVEKALQLKNPLLNSLKLLGRESLRFYEENCAPMEDPSFQELTASQIQILSQFLKGDAWPLHTNFIEAFLGQLNAELEDRTQRIRRFNAEVLQLQQIQEIGAQFLKSALTKEEFDAILQPGTILVKNDCLKDEYFAEIAAEHERMRRQQEMSGGVLVGLLIHKKYVLLAEINPQFAKISDVTVKQIVENQHKFQFDSPIDKLFALIQEISQIQQTLQQLQPLREGLQLYTQLKEENAELLLIQQNSSRFTSKSREALAIRKREEQIKKNLAITFPKVMAGLLLKIEALTEELNLNGLNLNDFDLFWNGKAGEPFVISVEQLLGVDYRLEIRDICQKQDIKFRQRFEQYLDMYRRDSAQLRITRSLEAMQQTATVVIKTPAPQKLNQKIKATTYSQNKLVGSQTASIRSTVRTPAAMKASAVEFTPGGRRTRIPMPK